MKEGITVPAGDDALYSRLAVCYFQTGQKQYKMKIVSILELFKKSYGICSEIVRRESLKDYQLDAYSFYQKFGSTIPLGEGFELEVCNYPEILSWHERERKLLSGERLIGLHVHTGNDSKPYVCYPLQMKTATEAIRMHKEWARVMFAQIFFGLTDAFLFAETKSGSTTDWARYVDAYFAEKDCQVGDWLLEPIER